MSQQSKLGKTATTVRTENGWTIIRYHQTDVVKFNEKSIILNTGGYFTPTTKTRMNQASGQFDLGYTIRQEKRNWKIIFDQEMDFYNNSSVEFHGNIAKLKRC